MPSNTTSHKSNMLDSLTSFRFVAAFLVFIWHSHVMSNLLEKYQLGYVGVGFFYILSGFILTYVYFNSLSTGKWIAIKKFYIARLAKIYPVHILTFIASIPLFMGTVQVLFPENTKLHFVELSGINLTLLQSFFPSNMINFSFNGVAWSISVEMFFYALFPLIVYIIGRYGKKLSVVHLVIIAFLVWLALLLMVAPVSSFIDDWRLYIFPPIRLPEFVIGILIGLIYLRGQAKRSDKSRYNITIRTATWLELISIGSLIAAIVVSPVLPQSVRFAAWLIPFWVLLIFVFSWQRGNISKFLSNKYFVYLGEISFSFYMIHQLVIRYMSFVPLHKVTLFIISFIITLVLSAIIYRFYEEPLRTRLKSVLEKTFKSQSKKS